MVIKGVQRERECAFLKEAKILSELSDTHLVPQIYFAYRTDPELGIFSVIGMEYRHGKSLLDWKNVTHLSRPFELRDSILGCIEAIHLYGFSHGDLSPRNILAQFHPGRKCPWEITLVDWEFGRQISKEDLRSYEQFRGTIGFGNDQIQLNLPARDWKAFGSCIEYLGIQKGSPTSIFERLQKWLKRI